MARPRGSRNWRTIELELKALAQRSDKPLAKEILERFMLFYAEAALRHLPQLPIPDDWKDAHKFHSFAEKACHYARMLAPYQSPTYRSVSISAPRESSVRGTPAIDALEAFVLTLAAVRRREPDPVPAEPETFTPTLVEIDHPRVP